MKACPFCRERIQDDAIECRYCSSSLLPPQPEETTGPALANSGPDRIVCVVDQGFMDQNQFDSFQELRDLVKQHILPEYQWYWNNTRGPRRLFRGAGIAVVIGSLTIPVITAAKNSAYRDWALTVVSLAVAILSSLNTFFRWDWTWQSRTRTANNLQGLLAKWELALSASKMAEKPQEAALSATQKLFDEAFSLVGSETKQFFATIQWPEISKSK